MIVRYNEESHFEDDDCSISVVTANIKYTGIILYKKLVDAFLFSFSVSENFLLQTITMR